MQPKLELARFHFQAEGESAVLVAGDPEKAHALKVRVDGGIYYHVNLLRAMVSIVNTSKYTIIY